MLGIPGRRLLIAMLVIFALAVIPAVFVPTLLCRQPDPVLDDIGVVPAFSLVDETGQTFTEEALRGHPTVVDFVFTRCDAICPALSFRMQRLQERTGDRKGSNIKLVSVTVDPDYDTPARLAEYATRYQADPTRWRFLTGPKDQVTSLVTKTFMIAMDRDGNTKSGAPNIAHQGYFILVDGDLHIRGVYDSNDEKRLEELSRAARFLARTGSDHSYKFGGP